MTIPLALATGGVFGAAVVVLVHAFRLPEALRLLSSAIQTDVAGRNGETAENVRRRLHAFEVEFGQFLAAIQKLRSVLRIKN